jgi:hypothetical protein
VHDEATDYQPIVTNTASTRLVSASIESTCDENFRFNLFDPKPQATVLFSNLPETPSPAASGQTSSAATVS